MGSYSKTLNVSYDLKGFIKVYLNKQPEVSHLNTTIIGYHDINKQTNTIGSLAKRTLGVIKHVFLMQLRVQ